MPVSSASSPGSAGAGIVNCSRSSCELPGEIRRQLQVPEPGRLFGELRRSADLDLARLGGDRLGVTRDVRGMHPGGACRADAEPVQRLLGACDERTGLVDAGAELRAHAIGEHEAGPARARM